MIYFPLAQLLAPRFLQIPQGTKHFMSLSIFGCPSSLSPTFLVITLQYVSLSQKPHSVV